MIGTICLVPFIMALITQLYGDMIVGAKRAFVEQLKVARLLVRMQKFGLKGRLVA